MNTMYRFLRLMNDILSIFGGTADKRIARKAVGRASGKIMSRIR